MKRTLLALCLALAPTAAAAEYLPDGCYVAFSNPGYCFVAYDNVSQWIQYANRNEGVYHYGDTVEAIIYEDSQSDAALSTCLSSYEANESNRQEWITYGNYQKKLVAKLRKACGTKCKKIK